MSTRSALRFLPVRPTDVHSTRPWSQYAVLNRELDSLVQDLSGSAGAGPGVRALDYGCGTRPYEALLGEHAEYVGADLPGNPRADVDLGPDGSVPLPGAGFDLVLSTQVLEHVLDPALYLAECARLLRPGGSLVLSTHGIMYYHRDPEDYWRWTMPGLVRAVEQHGMHVVERRGVLSLAATAVQLFQDATFWSLPRRLRPLYALVMQWIVRSVDRRSTAEDRAANGMVLAVRAVRAEAP